VEKSLCLVGELNPYGGDPAFALYHLPRNASGDRLRRHLGLTDATYEALPKVNLCEGEWDLERARDHARHLCHLHSVFVLCGVKVSRAFGGPRPFTWEISTRNLDAALVSVPHPSGLSRAWNDPTARERARDLLRQHAPWVPWGEASD
jgi:hypothetical protein